ncbi:MAG TPA: isocitrate lyase/phosphoenolpyruvate mutase family protein, partial [Jatrophihabitantaceae bacterium]|nr:isocitrate lyase/phosphoenolpyruvate mutase family protein [Jatrophihabitantaceae bacterium]
MSSRADDFLALHRAGSPLLIPNPWDAGSARVLAGLGFRALATTSGGFAATLGRLDGDVSRTEALKHAAAIAAAVDVPVSADLENGFADEPEDVAATVRDAAATGLAGCSIEDWSGAAIYPAELAAARVSAAVDEAHGGDNRLVITARAENFLRGNDDLGDTIARLQSFDAAGADVLYAPGLTDLEQIRTVVAEVSKPVNVLLLKGGPTVAELTDAGVHR